MDYLPEQVMATEQLLGPNTTTAQEEVMYQGRAQGTVLVVGFVIFQVTEVIVGNDDQQTI